MRNAFFLDTSGFVAASVRSQARHGEARAAYVAAVRSGARIVTTPMVLGESHALFLKLLGRSSASEAIASVLNDPTHVVVAVDDELVRSAIDRWIVKYRDHNFSLCDAVSFEVMEREELKAALAIDKHFVIAGFDIVGTSPGR